MFEIVVKLVYIFIGICGMGIVVGFHEFGHLIFAKIFNIKAPVFSIGMGPMIFKKKIGETVYSLSAIPLGGYVAFAGDDDDETPASDADKKHFLLHAPYYQKLCIGLGGIAFNLILGWAFLSFLFMVGLPKTLMLNPECAETTVSEVRADHPGAQAGLLKGDHILGARENGSITSFENAQEAMSYFVRHPDQSIDLQVERDGSIHWLNPHLNKRGQLGIGFNCSGAFPAVSFGQGLADGFSATWKIFKSTYEAFKSIVMRTNRGSLGGPLMIISQIMTSAQDGYRLFLFILAFISINLAFLNFIPIPILDGGQILLYTIEAIIRRPISDRTRNVIGVACWIAVLALFIILTFNDLMTMTNSSIGSLVSKFSR